MKTATRSSQPNTAEQERRREPLGNAVRVALQLYFRQLDGQTVTDLHRRVTEEVERPLLESTMDYVRGNQTLAARVLGVSRGTLRKKLRQYGLD